jgi:hypothetical protein
VTSGFERVTTTIVLEGEGAVGSGEDVSYDAGDHESYPAGLPLTGRWILADYSRHLEDLEFLRRPTDPSTRDHRRWAFESAALDLALAQAGRSLGEVLGRGYRPVRFVVSTRGDIRPWLAVDPALEFKLDPTGDWTRGRMEAYAATESVRVVDLKGWYEGDWVDQPKDPRLYADVAEIFRDALIEDPAWNEETRAALKGAEARLSWDAPVHRVADLDRLPVEPRNLNVKPSRFATVRELFACYDACRERGIVCYSGGQFELGVGRRQIQALASLFHPDAPNDVAPTAYNEGDPRAGLPRSPLEPRPRVGFSFADADTAGESPSGRV